MNTCKPAAATIGVLIVLFSVSVGCEPGAPDTALVPHQTLYEPAPRVEATVLAPNIIRVTPEVEPVAPREIVATPVAGSPSSASPASGAGRALFAVAAGVLLVTGVLLIYIGLRRARASNQGR